MVRLGCWGERTSCPRGPTGPDCPVINVKRIDRVFTTYETGRLGIINNFVYMRRNVSAFDWEYDIWQLPLQNPGRAHRIVTSSSRKMEKKIDVVRASD